MLSDEGFHTELQVIGPTCDIWLCTLSKILVHIHSSICTTHQLSLLPVAFANLTGDEHNAFDLTTHTISLLFSLFDDYHTNPNNTNICLCCLEEHQAPLDQALWRSVMITCRHNLHAAYTSIINNLTHSMTNDLTAWSTETRAEIMNKMIASLIESSSDFSKIYNDPHITAWMNMSTATLLTCICKFISTDCTDRNEDLIFWEATTIKNALNTITNDINIKTSETKACLEVQALSRLVTHY
jgi:hypothetical protein